jgi:hypothetical protein
MAKKMGRPPVPKAKALAEVFSVRLRRDEARQVSHAIHVSGQTKPDWLRDALLSAARKAKADG